MQMAIRGKNEMDKIICCLIVLVGMVACTTAGRPATADELEHQADIVRAQDTIDQLAERIKQYDNAITDAIAGFENVRGPALSIDANIDKLAEQFDEYDRAVNEMVRKLRAVQVATSGTD